jgi:hypothetical protein
LSSNAGKAATVGSLVRLEFRADIEGVLTDPTDLQFSLKVPGESAPLTYTLPAVEIVRDSTGVYHFDYVPLVAGPYVYSWNASGNIEVTNLSFLEVVSADIMTVRVPDYLTSADLDARAGAARVDLLFDDDGDSQRDPEVMNAIMCEAEDYAASRMLKSWKRTAIAVLAAQDITFRGHVAWVALELASERRAEWLAEDGKGRYWAQYQRAKEHFDALAKSQISSQGEVTAGANAQSGGKLGPTNDANRATFTFAADARAPRGHGGF